MLELFEIKPGTNYVVKYGDSSFTPSIEQLKEMEDKIRPLFEDVGSKVAVVSK